MASLLPSLLEPEFKGPLESSTPALKPDAKLAPVVPPKPLHVLGAIPKTE